MAVGRKEFDCTQESNDRGEAFGVMQCFFDSLRMTRRQFVFTETKNADGSFSFLIEGNGRAVGDPEPEKKPAVRKADKNQGETVA
jgi:hypothetical protein